MKISENYVKYVVLFGALLNFTVGNFYSYSNMVPYLNQTHNISINGDNVYVFSAGFIGMGSSVYLVSFLVAKYGYSMTALFASFFSSFNVLLMSFTLKHSELGYILTFGLLNGISTGIVYGVTIGIANSWFPKSRGLACGILMAAFPSASIILVKSQIDIINVLPKSTTMDYSFLILGGVYICLQIIGVLLLKDPSRIVLEENFPSVDMSMEKNFIKEFPNETIDIIIAPHKLIKMVEFWKMWLVILLLTACFGLNMALHITFGKSLKIVEEDGHLYLKTAMTWGLVSFAVGAVFWGWISDRFDCKKVLLIISIATGVLFATYYIPFFIENKYPNYSLIGIKAYYYIWVVLLYFFPGGLNSIFPCICARKFGKRNLITNYGLLCTAWTLSAAIVCIALSLLRKYYTDNLCHVGFYFGAVFALVATLIILTFKTNVHHDSDVETLFSSH